MKFFRIKSSISVKIRGERAFGYVVFNLEMRFKRYNAILD